MFKDDFDLMNSMIPEEKMADKAFCHFICDGVRLEQDMFIFNAKTKVELGKTHIIENERLFREVV